MLINDQIAITRVTLALPFRAYRRGVKSPLNAARKRASGRAPLVRRKEGRDVT